MTPLLQNFRKKHDDDSQRKSLPRKKKVKIDSSLIALMIVYIALNNWYAISNIMTLPFDSGNNNPNRTIVIIMGNLRGGEFAWKTLHRNVLNPSMADLALIIGEEPQESKTRFFKKYSDSLHRRAKYIWTFREYEDWGEAIDLVEEVNKTNWMKKIKETPEVFGGVSNLEGSGAIIMLTRHYLRQHIMEHNLTEIYDRFVITRSDHYYQCIHNVAEFDVSGNNVWIPPGSDYQGFTDRHLIVGSHNVMDALDIYVPFLLGEFNQEIKYFRVLNPERLIKIAWQAKGLEVKYFNRTMFTCARKFDTTRWTVAKRPVPGEPCLLQKYKHEYRMVQEHCPPIIPERKPCDQYRSLRVKNLCKSSMERVCSQD